MDMMPATLSPRRRKIDAGLSALLAVQALSLFVVIPLGTAYPAAHLMLDLCHLAFAVVCVAVLTSPRMLQAALLGALALLAIGPLAGAHLLAPLGFDAAFQHELIALTAFVFNAAVTALVARHVFGPGRVTAHRVQGAVLLYLNVAALFAIAYSGIELHAPGAILTAAGAMLPRGTGVQTAALTYFSLTTITTTGYGDLIPMHPLARSLAGLEAVFGQLFPATLLARIVALHLAHENGAPPAIPAPPVQDDAR